MHAQNMRSGEGSFTVSKNASKNRLLESREIQPNSNYTIVKAIGIFPEQEEVGAPGQTGPTQGQTQLA